MDAFCDLDHLNEYETGRERHRNDLLSTINKNSKRMRYGKGMLGWSCTAADHVAWNP